MGTLGAEGYAGADTGIPPGAGRRIEGDGTPEAEWRAWLDRRGLPVITIDDCVPAGARLVVVAPHPDDEILACGALLAMHAERGGRCAVIAVTDGDASHAGSPDWTRDRLAAARRKESSAGLAQLGFLPGGEAAKPTLEAEPAPALEPGFELTRLSFPDGTVHAHADQLHRRLLDSIGPRDVVVTTWRLDGHPDHEATGMAVADACRAMRATLLEAPVWMWHWAKTDDRRVPWDRMVAVALSDDALLRKQVALSMHLTQLEPRSQAAGPALDPVLGAEILKRSFRPLEYFFLTRPENP